MKIKVRCTLLMFAILVVGCASPRYVDRKLKDVLPLLAAGKYDVAVGYARHDFNMDDSDAATIRKEFAKYPGAGLAFKSRLRSEFASEADLNRFEAFPKSIELARRDAVISNSDAGELLSPAVEEHEVFVARHHVVLLLALAIEVKAQLPDGLAADGHEPLLVVFAQHFDEALLQEQVADAHIPTQIYLTSFPV